MTTNEKRVYQKTFLQTFPKTFPLNEMLNGWVVDMMIFERSSLVKPMKRAVVVVEGEGKIAVIQAVLVVVLVVSVVVGNYCGMVDTAFDVAIFVAA